MNNINEQVLNLKSTVFGGDAITTKSYSLRVPLDLNAQIEAITDVSGKSRNQIIIDILNLGLACFIEHLDVHERHQIGEAYDEIKKKLMNELMEQK